MDIPRFVRRMSSYGLDDNNNPAAVTPSALANSRSSSGLTVDTSVAKNSFRKLNTLERHSSEPQWGSLPTSYGVLGDETTTPSGSQSSRQTTPSSTRSEDHEQTLRRRRSNSECLLLAKTNGTQDLPGPCKEYISSVKQILARSEEKGPTSQRRRSMSLRTNPLPN